METTHDELNLKPTYPQLVTGANDEQIHDILFAIRDKEDLQYLACLPLKGIWTSCKGNFGVDFSVSAATVTGVSLNPCKTV